jgi:hypothetical protein
VRDADANIRGRIVAIVALGSEAFEKQSLTDGIPSCERWMASTLMGPCLRVRGSSLAPQIYYCQQLGPLSDPLATSTSS